MLPDGWQLGRLVAEPDTFNPSTSHAVGWYYFQFDISRGIVKRTPLHWDSAEPSGYFQLLLSPPAPKPEPVRRRRRRVNPLAHLELVWVMPQVKLPRPRLSLPRRRRIPRWVRRSFFSSLVVAGLFLLLYPVYPAIRFNAEKQLAVFDSSLIASSPTMPTQWGINQVIIPKIGVRTPILESSTQAILDEKEGVWHQRGTLKSNFVLAGHRFRFLPPNTSTFYNLNQLQPGDVVLIDWYNQRYAYTVQKNFVVKQDQTEILKDQASPLLTLYTCADREETERVVVVAVPQE